MTIFKYPLKVSDSQVLMLPENSQILCVQVQRDEIFLWAKVNLAKAPSKPRTIEVFGTGQAMDDSNRNYIGTVQELGGTLVWHIFERL